MERHELCQHGAPRRSDAATIAEAFRITARQRRTRSRSARRTTRSASPGRSCASGSTRSPAGCRPRPPARRQRRADARQPARVPPRRPRRDDVRRRAVLDLPDLHARPDRVRRRRRRRARSLIIRAGVPRPTCSRRARSCRTLEHVIVVDGDAPEGCTSLGRGRGLRARASTSRRRSPRSSPTTSLTLIYTSGTTGPPKGVQLDAPQPDRRWSRASRQLIEFPHGGRVISWLPAAHIAERAAHHYLPIVYGLQITCCPDPREVLVLPAAGATRAGSSPSRGSGRSSRPGLEAMLAASPSEQRARGAGARLEAATAEGPPRAGGRAGARGARRGRGARPTSRSSPACARCSGFDAGRGRQRRRGADAGRGARVLPRHRRAARRAVGHDRDLRRGRRQPARPHQDRDGRPADARASRSSSPRTASCSCAAAS